MPIDVNRSLARDSRGNMLWDSRDVLIETDWGPFQERQLIGQPQGGVIHRLGPGGMMIFMYCDEPGVFYNEKGGKVSDALAGACGFDVETLAKARRKRAALAKAGAQIDAEFAGIQSTKVVKERGEYRMVETAKDLYAIQFVEADGTGSPLTTVPLSLAQAEKLFEELAGADDHV